MYKWRDERWHNTGRTISNTNFALPIRLQFITRTLSNLFFALIGAYGANLALFLLLRWLVGERWSLIALFDSVLHLLLLPPLILLPLCLLWRRWWLALTLVPSVLVFLTSYGHFFVPRSFSAPPETLHLSLLTYNLQKDTHIPEPVIVIIREASADIVTLQELNPTIAASLEAEFAGDYPYRALHPDTGYTGQGILSRYPLLSDDYWRMSLGHQRVEVDLKTTTLTLYNTHPLHPFTERWLDFERRRDEIASILSRAAADQGAIILAGDFNMTDQSED